MSVATSIAILAGIAFALDGECLAIFLTLVDQHLNEHTQSPIVVDRSVPFRVIGLCHHLRLTQVANDNGTFSQFVGDQARRLMMTILLFMQFGF
jgi:hypothetical protein